MENTANQQKVDSFFKDLRDNDSIKAIAEHFSKEIDTVCRVMQKYTIILRYKSGDIKLIKIDFLEMESKIKIKQQLKFNQ